MKFNLVLAFIAAALANPVPDASPNPARLTTEVAQMRGGWFVVDSDADATAIQATGAHDSAELARKALDVLVCKAIADGWKRV